MIMSVPGFGQATGMAFLSEICDITRFRNAEQLAAYIGMIPMCHSSGEKDGTGDITIRKHAVMRCNLIEAAWVAVRRFLSVRRKVFLIMGMSLKGYGQSFLRTMPVAFIGCSALYVLL